MDQKDGTVWTCADYVCELNIDLGKEQMLGAVSVLAQTKTIRSLNIEAKVGSVWTWKTAMNLMPTMNLMSTEYATVKFKPTAAQYWRFIIKGIEGNQARPAIEDVKFKITTAQPTTEPTSKPTSKPTSEPTAQPTTKPTSEPPGTTCECAASKGVNECWLKADKSMVGSNYCTLGDGRTPSSDWTWAKCVYQGKTMLLNCPAQPTTKPTSEPTGTP